MNSRVPHPIQAMLAMMFVPPFALVSGILLGVLLWFLLPDTGLPTWARLTISLLVIPGLPGLWFVGLPILLWRHRVTKIELPAEVQAWQNAQFEAMERHEGAFSALRRQRIERVVAGGTSATADGIEMTVVAVELGASGGVITVVQRPLDEVPFRPPGHGDIPDAMPYIGPITHLADDTGTDYTVLVHVSEPVADGGRTRIDFIPPPPPGAGKLRLTMRGLHMSEGVVHPGPWEVTVPLV